MTSKGYVIKRLAQMVPVFLGILIINFVLIHIAPGDPASFLAGMQTPLSAVAALKQEWGLDKPIQEQLLIYLNNFFHGNLGYSYRFQEPVLSIIIDRLPSTLLLTISAYILAVLIGIYLGVSSSKKPFSFFDSLVTTFSVTFYSVPIFWLGIIFIIIFSLRLGIFPVQGMYTIGADMPFFDSIFDLLRHLFLPMTTLALVQMASYCRFTRASMLEELRKDYIITARSKGLDEHSIYYTHALKNAMIPVITIMGLQFSNLFTGSLLIETVFAWPGIGRLMYDSILARDYPVLMGSFIIISLIILIINFITDLIYANIDPRIRYK